MANSLWFILFFVILLILLCIPQDGNALKCFVCNSAFDENCDSESPPLRYLVDCSYLTARPIPHHGVEITVMQNKTTAILQDTSIISENSNFFETPDEKHGQNFTSCRKQDVTIPEQDNGVGLIKPETIRIVRSCGWLGYPTKDACKVISREEILSQHCSCLKDACNKGVNIIGSSTLMTIFIWGAILIIL